MEIQEISEKTIHVTTGGGRTVPRAIKDRLEGFGSSKNRTPMLERIQMTWRAHSSRIVDHDDDMPRVVYLFAFSWRAARVAVTWDVGDGGARVAPS